MAHLLKVRFIDGSEFHHPALNGPLGNPERGLGLFLTGRGRDNGALIAVPKREGQGDSDAGEPILSRRVLLGEIGTQGDGGIPLVAGEGDPESLLLQFQGALAQFKVVGPG